MTAAAQVFAEKHCPNCRRMKPVEAFRSHCYCLECRAAYQRARHKAIREGSWKPKTRCEYTAQRASAVIRDAQPPEPPPPLFPPVTEAAEDRLRTLMLAFMAEFGFTALHVTYVKLEGEVARKRRMDVAREGWIA